MFNENILREYDIRGKYKIDFDENFAYVLGQAYGTFLQNNKFKTCVVGRDIRNSSDILQEYLCRGLISTGIKIFDIGKVTTPMTAFSTIKFNSPAIMVTASHNPKDENGFKLFLNNNYSLCGDEIKKFYDYLKKTNFKIGKGKIKKVNIFKSYLKSMFKGLSFGKKKIKVIIDPGNGSGALFIKKIMKKVNAYYEIICSKPDGNFPYHHPDPSVLENMKMLQEKVLETKADLGIAYDGDADRVGIVSEKGEVITPDLLMLIVWKNIINNTAKKECLFDVKCSMALKNGLKKIGVKPILYKTGASLVKNKINADKILFGGEYSGHLVFNDKYLGIDDGIYSGLRFIEILSNSDKPISSYLLDCPKYYEVPETKFKTNDNLKHEIINNIKKELEKENLNIIQIDGIRIETDDYMISLRASNTGPNLTLRIEATSIELKEELLKKYSNLINKYNT